MIREIVERAIPDAADELAKTGKVEHEEQIRQLALTMKDWILEMHQLEELLEILEKYGERNISLEDSIKNLESKKSRSSDLQQSYRRDQNYIRFTQKFKKQLRGLDANAPDGGEEEEEEEEEDLVIESQQV
eukprot:CAMPEP_0113716516 /NCGR_PEP_ID=MMETSP0038_2-20120614/33943_1 /TAXON_ID=2898 /ORGANISM="Cryptomonas paramecium" /LENGTH=130 /DNA_ID=CAMNT_0000644067 /DNA_START=1 /DNA_END=390 /DNA_ORIENTATION=+ /assembly_acc=CAM_ASM_000170